MSRLDVPEGWAFEDDHLSAATRQGPRQRVPVELHESDKPEHEEGDDCPHCRAMAGFALRLVEPSHSLQANYITIIAVQKALGLLNETLEELAEPLGTTKQAIDAATRRIIAQLPGPLARVRSESARGSYSEAARKAWAKRRKKKAPAAVEQTGEGERPARQDSNDSTTGATSTTEGATE